MTIALILACVVALAAVLALAGVATTSRTAPGPSFVGKTVVVHTRKPDDQSVRGVVIGHHVDRLILREAVYLHAESSVDAGGLVHIPTLTISTIQEIEPVTEPS